ncbi:unnamed protein product, partial [Owenia fusiformis]
AFDAEAFCAEACRDTGGGYFPYPGDCCRYIVCAKTEGVRETDPDFISTSIARCPSTLLWSKEKATCDYPFHVPDCDLSCHESEPEPSTLSPPPIYNASRECIRENDIYIANVPSFTESCYMIEDGSEELLCCPSGQVFNLTECGCVLESDPEVRQCNCILVFDFDNEDNFGSTQWETYLDIHGKLDFEIEDDSDPLPGFPVNKKGCFDGENDAIEVPFFNSYIYGGTLSIFFYFEIPEDAPSYMGLLSNGCCNDSATIAMWIEDGKAYLNFTTEKAALVKYPFDEIDPLFPNELNDVTFVYCDPVLEFHFTGTQHEKSIILGGDIVTTPCPLHIGSINGDENTRFKGCMENFVICQDCWAQFDERRILFLQSDLRAGILESVVCPTIS